MTAMDELIRKVSIIPVPTKKKKKKPPINTPSSALNDMRLREDIKEYELYKLKRKRKGSEGYSPQGEPDFYTDFLSLGLDRRMTITPEAFELRRRPKDRRFNI